MTSTPSLVAQIPAASAEENIAHISQKLRFETDCWDTHASLQAGAKDFVIFDVRSREHYEQGHVPGAVHLPRGKMTPRRIAEWSENTLFVAYCAGPHCNGADKAALELAKLGKTVKIMIGGATGWADEGFEFTTGAQAGSINELA